MSYEKQTWTTGDIITADKLNHMEDGIAGGGLFIVNYVYGDEVDTLNKTYAEIKSAFLSGKIIYILVDNSFDNPEFGYTLFEYYIVTSLSEKVGQESSYHVLAKNWDFASATEDGVLTLSD